MKEPQTAAEFEAALKTLNAEVVEDGEYFVEYRGTDGRRKSMKLEATGWSSALFEAWHLLKPES